MSNVDGTQLSPESLDFKMAMMISGTPVPAWLALSVGVAAVLYKDFHSTGRVTIQRSRTRVAPFITAAILFCLFKPGSAQIVAADGAATKYLTTEPTDCPAPVVNCDHSVKYPKVLAPFTSDVLFPTQELAPQVQIADFNMEALRIVQTLSKWHRPIQGNLGD